MSRSKQPPLSCMNIWTTCSLHGVPVGSCLFWVSSVFSFFPPWLCRGWYCSPCPPISVFIPWQPMGEQEGIYTPLIFLLVLPLGVAGSENIVFWRLCQNKNPQRGRRGAARVVCVFTLLSTMYSSTFSMSPRQAGCGLSYIFWLLGISIFALNMKGNIFFLFRIMNILLWIAVKYSWAWFFQL